MKTAVKRQPIKLEPFPQSRVEIINLIDVMITLIAFFMLTTVFAGQENHLRVDLPEVSQVHHPEQAVRKLLIEVDRENRIRIHRQLVTLEQLEVFLKGQPFDTVVVIGADQASRYGTVIQVVDRVKKSKLKKIDFKVKRDES